MLCATAKGQGSAAVVNRICQGNSAGACAMGRVALLRAPRPHGRAPLPHGASLLGCQTAVLGAAGAVRAGGAPRPLAAPGAICARPGRAGRQPRAALRFIFFFAKGRCPSRIRKTCSNCRCGTGPYTYVQALPEFMHAFGGAGNHTQGRQPLGLARSTVKPHKPGGGVNTLDAGWQPRRHDQLRTPAHV